MQRIQFNTGRRYTREGQRIVAMLHEDGVVTFMDHDRKIAGEFDICDAPFDRRTVLDTYDCGAYRMSSRAMSPDHALED